MNLKKSRGLRFLELGALGVPGDDGPTPYRQRIGEVARHFGAEAVGQPGFELPRAWEFEAWRSRRVLGDLEAESA